MTNPQTTVRRAFAAIGRSRWREVGAAGLLFAALAFAIFGWYVSEGGFVADDWVNADKYRFHSEPGFWGAVDNYQTPSRPVAAVYVTSTHALLGTHFEYHLLLALLLAAFLSTAFFVFLRALGLDWRLALAAAALLLVFPSSDSTRFWATGSQINLFIGLYLVAATIAMEGRRRFGPAPTLPAVATQALASALAVTAVAGYEIVAPAVLLSFVLYGWIDREGAIWRWLFDAIPTVLVLILYTQKFGGGAAHGTQLLTNVRLVADGAVSVLSYTLVPTREISNLLPFWELSRWSVFWGVVAVIVATLLVRRFRPAIPGRDAIGRWLWPLLLAVIGIAIGYAMIIPAADRYPLYAPGVQNRTNCFAALGFCALVTFLFAAIASMLAAAVPRLSKRGRARLGATLAGLLILGMFAAYTVRIVQDGQRWAKSAEIQAEILDGAHAMVPSPPADATIYTSPFPGYSSPSLPIFGGGGNNDEVGAFKVTYNSDEMRAFPLLEGIGINCGPASMETPDTDHGETQYGKAILIDFRTHAVYRPQNRNECLRDTVAMEPYGPVNLREDW